MGVNGQVPFDCGRGALEQHALPAGERIGRAGEQRAAPEKSRRLIFPFAFAKWRTATTPAAISPAATPVIVAAMFFTARLTRLVGLSAARSHCFGVSGVFFIGHVFVAFGHCSFA